MGHLQKGRRMVKNQITLKNYYAFQYHPYATKHEKNPKLKGDIKKWDIHYILVNKSAF